MKRGSSEREMIRLQLCRANGKFHLKRMSKVKHSSQTLRVRDCEELAQSKGLGRCSREVNPNSHISTCTPHCKVRVFAFNFGFYCWLPQKRTVDQLIAVDLYTKDNSGHHHESHPCKLLCPNTTRSGKNTSTLHWKIIHQLSWCPSSRLPALES